MCQNDTNIQLKGHGGGVKIFNVFELTFQLHFADSLVCHDSSSTDIQVEDTGRNKWIYIL